MKTTAAVLSLAVLTQPLALHAEEGPYGGLGFGSASYDISVSDWDDGSITTGSVDDSDTGFKLFAGYRVNENLAVEAAYVGLGETTFSGQSSGGFFWCAGAVEADVEAATLSFSGLGILPINPRFSIHGKFGFHMWDADLTVRDSCGVFSGQDDGTDPLLGIGATYHAGERFGLRVEWEQYKDILDVDVDLLSISGVVRF